MRPIRCLKCGKGGFKHLGDLCQHVDECKTIPKIEAEWICPRCHSAVDTRGKCKCNSKQDQIHPWCDCCSSYHSKSERCIVKKEEKTKEVYTDSKGGKWVEISATVDQRIIGRLAPPMPELEIGDGMWWRDENGLEHFGVAVKESGTNRFILAAKTNGSRFSVPRNDMQEVWRAGEKIWERAL